MLVFCPLACEGILPLTRCHEYESGLIPKDDNGAQVNMTLFNAATVELAGVATTSVIKTFMNHVYQ